jgi:carboxyl-terminal processing protease
MFRKTHESLKQKLLQLHLGWGTLAASLGAVVIAAPLLLLAAGTAAAEPTRSTWRTDSSPYSDEPEILSPPRLPQPPIDNNINNNFPGNPNDEAAPPVPERFRSREPEEAPRHHLRHERRAPRHDEELPERELIQRKLTSHYGNPAVIRLLHSLSAQQSLEVYLEVSGLIDARHLKPSTYDARVKQAVKNLCAALDNPAFLRANELGDDPGRLDSLRRDFVRVAEGQPVKGADDAYQALQWTMQTAERDAGLRPTAVALEFIFAATDSLDKYSAFVPAMTGRASPSAELEDHVVGIGVEIKADERGMLIANALPGGPAAEAGLRGGDIIESINGQRVSGGTLDSAVDLISGPAGSQLTLSVRRDERVAEVKLVRRRVEVHSVSEVKMLENGVGYIKLEKFAQNSSEECDKALWDLYRQGMKSVVVDVRGNPGGLLTTAIQMSNKFVPSGTIVSTRGRDATDNTVEYARRDRTWKLPLVVLVDENSASASEIFAAAVQENGRGVIVGRKTYGKGTVQTHFPLQTIPGVLRLTTAQFFSPTGREMAGAGVEPDVHVDAEQPGRQAYYEHEAPYRHDESYAHERFDDHDGYHQHEAAYRHGAAYRHEGVRGPDRDIATAIDVATSKQALDLAQAAGNRRDGNAQAVPMGR